MTEKSESRPADRDVAAGTCFRAAWIFPGDAPPIADGLLEVDSAGRITAVTSGRRSDAIDLGNVAIIPALVNAHCHLEFSDLTHPLSPPRPFADWIRTVLAHRRNRPASQEALVRSGWQECVLSGSAAVGEIVTADLPAATYPADGIRGTLFREVIGPRAENWDELLGDAAAFLDRSWPAHLQLGLSPHAPYTVPEELFDRLLELAVRRQVPVAVHLAETREELELLDTGTGELVELLRAANLWSPELHPAARRPIDWLRKLSGVSRGLVIHGNYLDLADREFLASQPSLTLVYCPRTHHYFGHPTHPFEQVLALGGQVALGTDGRSSNPDLDLWQECVFVKRHYPSLSDAMLLQMATGAGASALGWQQNCGSLNPGKSADFCAVRLSESTGLPPELFLPEQTITAVVRQGLPRNPLR